MSNEFTPPYKPSWVDRFTDWIESLPGPYWLAVLIIYLLLSIQSQLVNWISEIEPWGELHVEHFIYQLFTTEVLFFWKFLDQDAIRALHAFSPMLQVNEDEFVELEYRLTNQTSRGVAILTVIGAVIGAYYSYSVEVINRGGYEISVAAIYGAIGFAIPMTLALVFCYRIIHQLRIISRMYESASEIDLFHLDPVYALSSHTAKTGLIFLFLVYSNLLLSPSSIQIPTALIATILLSIISFAAFVLPLRGINRRLVAEKKNMLVEINSRIKKAFYLLEEDFDKMELDQIQGLDRALSTLERQKIFVEKIPTWPWGAGTMRGFISAMLLPILSWVIQQILGRLITF